MGFDVQDLFVQVAVVIHLKSTLPHQFHDQRRRLFIVLRQGNLVGTLDPLQDSDPSRRSKHIRCGFASGVAVILGCMEFSRPPLVIAFELSETRKAIVADALAGVSDVVAASQRSRQSLPRFPKWQPQPQSIPTRSGQRSPPL